MRRTLLPLTAAVALAVAAAVPAAAAPTRDSYLLKPVGPAADQIFPEGIATDGRQFFVGSTTDGTVYRGTLAGRVATPFLLGGADDRTSLTGLKVDDGQLLAAGAATGRFFAYDIESRELVGSYQVQPAPSTAAPSFLNDETVTPDGSVYITDSVANRPYLYRVGPDRATDGVEPLEVFLDFTGTALQYTAGFNVNGIASSADGRYLVLAKSNTRDLYRVDLTTKAVSKIDLGGAPVAGDGLVLDGTTLYAIERQTVAGQAGAGRLRREDRPVRRPRLGHGREPHHRPVVRRPDDRRPDRRPAAGREQPVRRARRRRHPRSVHRVERPEALAVGSTAWPAAPPATPASSSPVGWWVCWSPSRSCSARALTSSAGARCSSTSASC